MAIALVVFTAGYLYTLDLRSRVSELESVIHSQNGELARFRSRSLDRSDTAGGAGQQMIPSIPGGSVPGTEHERDALASPQQAVTGSPRTAEAAAMPGNEETPDSSSDGLSGRNNTGTAMPAEPAALPGQSAASTYAGDQAAVKHGGPWVINLLSSPIRSDADRFAEKARNQGIPVEQRRVILNDREFFRVQLTGFMTQKLAEESAGPVKERLGLKDVWIFKP
jgi:cell division septation protein DedD